MRSFQDIVDEAKRLIPQYVPEWTDHNLSDPGVALIELFAWMTESIIYRLNQVPDDIYWRFLQLVGIRPFPSVAAQTDLLFMLTAPAAGLVTVPAGTQVGTEEVDDEDSIVFMTDRILEIVPPELAHVVVSDSENPGRYRDQWDEIRFEGASVPTFRTLQPDDAIYFGFENSLASLAIRLDVTASTEGVGVRPEDPPWAWEVWDGEQWSPVRVQSDETGGLNQDGEILLLLPKRHEPLSLGNVRSHWLRCRMTEAGPGQEPYHKTPEITALAVFGVGGSVSAHHGELHDRELLGVSDYEPAQEFFTLNRPVLDRIEGETVEVVEPDGEPVMWSEVPDFTDLNQDSLNFVWDAAEGRIRFGPRIRFPDGNYRQFGAVPPRGAEIYLTSYRSGGGARGNVGANTLTRRLSGVSFVASVTNPEPATGGVDAETLDGARMRGAMELKSGDRAVTAEDFERLAHLAAPSVARAKVIVPSGGSDVVRLLIVPRVEKRPAELTVDDMAISDELFETVQQYLEERRILGTAVSVEAPKYIGVKVAAEIVPEAGRNEGLVKDRAMDALYKYISPLTGGPSGQGWPFEVELNVSQVFSLLSEVDGLERVERVLLYTVDLETGEREPRGGQAVKAEAGCLFMSYQHSLISPEDLATE